MLSRAQNIFYHMLNISILYSRGSVSSYINKFELPFHSILYCVSEQPL